MTEYLRCCLSSSRRHLLRQAKDAESAAGIATDRQYADDLIDLARRCRLAAACFEIKEESNGLG